MRMMTFPTQIMGDLIRLIDDVYAFKANGLLGEIYSASWEFSSQGKSSRLPTFPPLFCGFSLSLIPH